jgi:alpha-tubulin suppressor-like RCC1 family protein
VRRLILMSAFVLLLVASTSASAQVYHFGSYGRGEENLFPTPVLEPGLEDATRIDAGNASGFALVGETVMAFGTNEHGQLGDGTTTASQTPVAVDFPSGVHIVAIGEADESGYAIDSTGQGWAWGKAGDQLCLGKIHADVLTPEKVPGMTKATAVQGGGPHVLWLLSNGTVESCGLNPHGELGDGSTESSARPVAVSGLSGVVEVSAGEQSSCARTASGAAYDWGLDEDGQVGNGVEEASVVTPFHVPLAGSASKLSCGGSLPDNGHTLALVGSTAYGWGDDEYGQLGDGQKLDKLTPTQAVEVGPLAAIVASGESSLGLTTGGEVEAWGSNRRGALGQGTGTGKEALKPRPVASGAVEISATATDAEYRT